MPSSKWGEESKFTLLSFFMMQKVSLFQMSSGLIYPLFNLSNSGHLSLGHALLESAMFSQNKTVADETYLHKNLYYSLSICIKLKKKNIPLFPHTFFFLTPGSLRAY